MKRNSIYLVFVLGGAIVGERVRHNRPPPPFLCTSPFHRPQTYGHEWALEDPVQQRVYFRGDVR